MQREESPMSKEERQALAMPGDYCELRNAAERSEAEGEIYHAAKIFSVTFGITYVQLIQNPLYLQYMMVNVCHLI